MAGLIHKYDGLVRQMHGDKPRVGMRLVRIEGKDEGRVVEISEMTGEYTFVRAWIQDDGSKITENHVGGSFRQGSIYYYLGDDLSEVEDL